MQGCDGAARLVTRCTVRLAIEITSLNHMCEWLGHGHELFLKAYITHTSTSTHTIQTHTITNTLCTHILTQPQNYLFPSSQQGLRKGICLSKQWLEVSEVAGGCSGQWSETSRNPPPQTHTPTHPNTYTDAETRTQHPLPRPSPPGLLRSNPTHWPRKTLGQHAYTVVETSEVDCDGSIAGHYVRNRKQLHCPTGLQCLKYSFPTNITHMWSSLHVNTAKRAAKD